MPKPNILIFNPDQWRGDALGHMGHPAARTPNLDRFVETEGVSFRWAFCQNTVCTPSRCSFMSGWYPHVRGHRTMHHMMKDDEPVLLRRLKDEGYHVWWGGKNDLVPSQEPGVFEKYATTKYRPTFEMQPSIHALAGEKIAAEDDKIYSFYLGKLESDPEAGHRLDGDWAWIEGAIEFIKTRSADESPFCIYLPVGYPHPPYGVEEPWYSAIDRAKVPPPAPVPEDWFGKPSLLKGIYENQNLHGLSADDWAELRATYLGMCARLDRQFGLLMDALREAGVYDETAVFMFSDHGDFTGDYGLVEKTQNTFEDCLSRVPFVVKPPSNVPVKPRVSEAMVELVDFPATVFDLTGIDAGYTHFGRSLLPVIAGETDAHRDAVFCEGGRLEGEEHCKEKESKGHENRNNVYWPRLTLQAGDGPEHGKATMCRTACYKYVRRLYESDELYDLERDPQELVNRVDDPELADVLSDMKDRLLTHYQATCDVAPHETDER